MDKDTLVKIAKLNNLRPWQQEKHYVQSLILIALSEYPLVFKGGTYLWLFHHLNRFSEDLDFTSTEKLPEELEEDVSNTLRLFGVENAITTISETDSAFSFRIAANGPLHTTSKDVCYVYVEISTRERVIEPPIPLQVKFSYYDLPLKIISGMALEEVAAEKVRAIFTRNKARDISDLAFLIKKKHVNFELEIINKKLSYYDLKFSKAQLKQKVAEKKPNWKSELEQLVAGELPEFGWAQKIIFGWAESGSRE